MTLREVAEKVGGWVDPQHGGLEIHGLASLTDANSGDLAFYGNPKYLSQLRKTCASAVLVSHGFGEQLSAACVWVDQPASAFASLLPLFAPKPILLQIGIHPTALIGEGVSLGENVSVGAYAILEAGVHIGARTFLGAYSYVGHDSSVGEDSHIHPRVTIRERCTIGARAVIHPGVVIGADGFGFEFREGRQQKIPQTGTVCIDDDVEIGSNSTIDRARFGRTWIQTGVKIDNLVQIGHNCVIGEHSVLCAQVGVSGSTRVGKNVSLAGKVGLNGHIVIGDRAMVGSMSGVGRSIPPDTIYMGAPARPIDKYKKNYSQLQSIHRLYDRVTKLEAENKRPT